MPETGICCFNGAGPSRTRKDARRRAANILGSGFNGAGPSRTRKAGGAQRVAAGDYASMGPGPLGPGKLAHDGESCRGCGSFNGAGPSRTRKAAAPATLRVGWDASMGPGPLGPGKEMGG